jgi:hypothetical protein
MAQTRGLFDALNDNVDKTLSGDYERSPAGVGAHLHRDLQHQDLRSEVRAGRHLRALRRHPGKGEGEVYAMDFLRQGNTKDFTHTENGLKFEVTQTALEDDAENILSRAGDWLAFSARYVEEGRAANPFNNGFSTETTPDGVSLFNATHLLKGGRHGEEHAGDGGGSLRDVADAGADRPADRPERRGGASGESGQQLDALHSPGARIPGGSVAELGGLALERGQRPQPDQGAAQLGDRRQSPADGCGCVVPRGVEQEQSRAHVLPPRADHARSDGQGSAHQQPDLQGPTSVLGRRVGVAGRSIYRFVPRGRRSRRRPASTRAPGCPRARRSTSRARASTGSRSSRGRPAATSDTSTPRGRRNVGAFDFGSLGNTPINSTSAPVAAPSTSTLLAELDSTQLGTKDFDATQSRLFRVSWVLGADTNVTWQCESALNTGLSSASFVDVFYPKTATALSAEFVTSHVLTKNMRLRARLFSTGANAAAFISAEPL